MKQVELFTDGACLGNPGSGGYGVILKYGNHRKELSGGYRLTTNNRMELTAVIAGLKALKSPCQVTVYSDSQYLVNAMVNGSARRWQANHWKRNKKDLALNPDLWQQILDLCAYHQVRFEWVKGHAGHSENEQCDILATRAASQPNLPADDGYKSPSTGLAPLLNV